jgi:hypothetical protein
VERKKNSDMRRKITVILLFVLFPGGWSCSDSSRDGALNIAFLHHSTGGVIWEGDLSQVDNGIKADFPGIKAQVPLLFAWYNRERSKNYVVKDIVFPQAEPYGWNNYPYDYYNIWVKNAGDKAFMKEPTLEMLTGKYQVIIFKHCFPSSNILEDNGTADINSDSKTLGNYKLQYLALRDKIHEFPGTRFILFTGAVQVQSLLSEEEAMRAREFHDWVVSEWDQPDDNIFLWDLYQLQTEGGLFFRNEYAAAADDSHPNREFAGRAAGLLFNRITDVIESDGTGTDITGRKL